MNTERKYVYAKEDYPYAEFKQSFKAEKALSAKLLITANYKYAAFVNGKLVGNCQFADIPEYKTVSELNIAPFLVEGENVLEVRCFNLDKSFSQCKVMPFSLSFSVIVNDKCVAVSGENTLARKIAAYSVGSLETPQIGEFYNYDFTAESEPYAPARTVNVNFTETPKPIKNTFLQKTEAVVAAQGVYKKDGGDSAAEIMQNAFLKTADFAEMTDRPRTAAAFPLCFKARQNADGIFVIFDLQRECAGFPNFTVTVDEPITCYMGFGEHLNDLRVRTLINERNFGAEIKLKVGKNVFEEYLRRIGCRYITLFFETERKVTVDDFCFYEELYPLKKPEKHFNDRLLDKIYQTGRRTLELCMHEHYEDCPWREQALYGMDSRNQMLFGYGAFEEYQFPKASLLLISKCLIEEGLVPICPPSENRLVIPSFSAYWVIAVYENAVANYDEEFLKQVIDSLEKVVLCFERHTVNGLVNTFGEKRFWNFHEWSDGLEGGTIFKDKDESTRPDGLLHALTYSAAKKLAELEKMLGRTDKELYFNKFAQSLLGGFNDFYDEQKGLFRSYIDDAPVKNNYHEFTQALFLYTGATDKKQTENVTRALIYGNPDLVPVTLAGLSFKYDGILKYTDDKQFVLNDICEKFGKMIYGGATSFWETELGEADFGNAGSLCHGWSAVPCYVLDKYFSNEQKA